MTRTNNFRAALNEIVDRWKRSANTEIVGDYACIVCAAHWNIEIRSNEDRLAPNISEVFERWYRCH